MVLQLVVRPPGVSDPTQDAAEFDPGAAFDVISSKGDTFDPTAPIERVGAPKKHMKASEGAGASDYAASVMGGFNKGLGAPVDILNAVLGLGGLGSEKPFMGSKWIEENTPFVPPPVDDLGGRMGHRIGEEFGAAALPSAGMMKLGSQVANGVRQVPGLLDPLLRGIGNSPGRALVGEAAATAGAGTGAAMAREAAPDNHMAEMGAQLAGGFAPAVVGAMSPLNLARRTISKINGLFGVDAMLRGERHHAATLFRRELTPDARASLRKAEEIKNEIPGFNPSVAEATGSPSLMAHQRKIEAEASGPDLSQLVNRKRDSSAAIDRYTETAAPSATNNPDFALNTANDRVQTILGGIDSQRGRVQAQREGVAGSLPRIDRADAGGTLRNELNAERAARRERLDQRAAELGVDDLDVTGDYVQFSNRVQRMFEPQSPFDNAGATPEVTRTIRGAAAAAQLPEDATPVTLRHLKSLRERVSDDLIDASGGANQNRRLVMNLGRLRNEVDGLIERAGQNHPDPGFGERYRQFRTEYFKDYIEPFEQGAAHKVRARDGRAFYQTSDEKVAQQFFKAGDTTSAEQFNSIFAQRPTAQQAMRDTILDSFREAAVHHGTIDPNRAAAWLRQHASVLERFPQVRAELANPVMQDMAYIRRQEQLATRQKTVEETMLARSVERYGKGATADSVVDAALREPRKMQQLVGAVRRSDGALAALRRNVWDKAVEGDATSVSKFVEKNRASLRRLFGEDHLRRIETIGAAREMLERVPTPIGAAYQPRPLEKFERFIGQGLPQFSSRMFALKAGRIQKGYLLIETTLRGLRGRAAFHADDALRAAMYDFETAKIVADALEHSSMNVVKAKRLQSRLIALGIPLVDRPEPQGDEQ